MNKSQLRKLKKSAENKSQIIPADYNDRISSLLAGLPEEPPKSESTDISVIRSSSRFDIKPIVSAAAVFVFIAGGILSYPRFSQSAHKDKNNDNSRPVITTSGTTAGITAETTSETTTAVTGNSTSDNTDNVLTGSVTAHNTERHTEQNGNELAVSKNTEKHTVTVTKPVEVTDTISKTESEASVTEKTEVTITEKENTVTLVPNPPLPDGSEPYERPDNPNFQNNPNFPDNPGKPENDHPQPEWPDDGDDEKHGHGPGRPQDIVTGRPDKHEPEDEPEDFRYPGNSNHYNYAPESPECREVPSDIPEDDFCRYE